jgi:hypothetical protein
MSLYAERVPEEFLPDIYKKIDSDFGGDYGKYADWLYEESQFTSLEKLLELLKTSDTEKINSDPAMEFALSTLDMGYELAGQLTPYYENILKGEREFMAALMEMDSHKTFYPDANFTQRLSYGSVKSYRPSDAVFYNYFTTSKGILEKYKPGDPEFDIQDYIVNDLRSGDFGRYADENGVLRVNFLSTNDITGGNSGSPVLNGKGELIGLAFDGNWESLSGDLLFEPEMQRTISVDILYTLYMLDKVMDAQYIIGELNMVN